MFFDDLSYLLGPQSVLEFVPPERWELYALLVLTLVMVTCCVPSSRQSSRGNEPKMIPYLVPCKYSPVGFRLPAADTVDRHR